MGPRRNNEKPKDLKKAIRILFAYLKPFYRYLIIATILALIGSIFSIIGPDKIKEITNIIVSGLASSIDMKKIKSIVFFLVTIYAVGAICMYIENYLMATVTNRFSKKLRGEISVKINKLPLKYFDSTSYGDILSRVTNDVDTMAQTIGQSMGTLVSSLTLLLGSVFMMFYTNYISLTASRNQLEEDLKKLLRELPDTEEYAVLRNTLAEMNYL